MYFRTEVKISSKFMDFITVMAPISFEVKLLND